ncbi:diguanylate cyclase domain-containing protein [Modestobacter lapidis]
MQRSWRVFTASLVLLGALALAVEVVRSAAGVAAAPGTFAVVTATVALLVFSPITVGSRARATHMTFGETAGVVAFAVLPPAQAALSLSLAALVLVLVLMLRTSAHNKVFNAASAVTSAAAGGLVAAGLQAFGAPAPVAAAGAAVVFGTVSHLQVVTALSIDRGALVPGVAAGLRQLAGVEAVGTALGLVLAPLLLRDPPGAWRLLPLLLALAVLSRRQARLAAERDLLDALAEVTQDLHSSLRHDEVLDALHAHADRLLPRSEVALQPVPPRRHQVGVQVDDAPLWLVARSGVSQVGVPTEQRVLHGLSAAAQRALDNARLHRQVEEQARTDPLTGLPNRVTLVSHLDRELARIRRHGGRVSLAFLDLDGFKRINDERGHEAGDALLVDLARHLRQATRAEDLVARLAGDEFCVVFDGLTDREQLIDVAGQLRGRLERELAAAGVGVSLGVAQGPADGADAGGLLHVADLAMYADKADPARSTGGGARSAPDRAG